MTEATELEEFKPSVLMSDKPVIEVAIVYRELAGSFDENAEYVSELYNSGERALMITYWNIGRIVAGMLGAGETYGKRIIPNLSESSGIAPRTIADAVTFYKKCPSENDANKLGDNEKVKWSHIRLLNRVKEPAKRDKLLEEISVNQTTVVELESKIKNLNVGKIQRAKQKDKAKRQRYKPVPYFNALEHTLKRTHNQYISMHQTIATQLTDMEAVAKVLETDTLTSEEDFKRALAKLKDCADVIQSVQGMSSKIDKLFAHVDKLYNSFLDD